MKIGRNPLCSYIGVWEKTESELIEMHEFYRNNIIYDATVSYFRFIWSNVLPSVKSN